MTPPVCQARITQQIQIHEGRPIHRQNTLLAASENASKDRQYNQSLARGIHLLKAFHGDDNGLSNAELSSRTGYPKPTVSRLTFTLMALGLLELDEDSGRYSLHPHILSLGYPVLKRFSIREIARPFMRELAESCKTAVAMATRDRLNMIIIERTRHRTMQAVPVDIGIGRPMVPTAHGRAYIAALGPRERAELEEELKAANESSWPQIKETTEHSTAMFHRVGYCVSDGDWRPDYQSVAVPLILPNDMIVTFSCGGFRDRIDPAEFEKMGAKLVDMVSDLSRLTGQGSLLS